MKSKLFGIVILFTINMLPVEVRPKIGIVGCGYVGLTMAAVMADGLYEVLCFDINKQRILDLKSKILPIYEPGLNDKLFCQAHSKNLKFLDSLDEMLDCDVFYICTPTPTDDSGNCDISYVHNAFQDLINSLSSLDRKIIVIKSTVPPQTVRGLVNCIPADKKNISVIYNPEFLREGSALVDVYETNPIILGGESEEAIEKMVELYDFLLKRGLRLIRANYESAEMIKYSWNSFSAIRIAYINDLAYLCRELGANIFTVVDGMALSESLLPTHVIKPGPGYGGSCLPKDAKSFSRVLEKSGFKSSLAHQAIKSNQEHIKRIIDDIFGLLEGDFDKKTVSILGLSFKANTNDIRFSPSIQIIGALLERGVMVKAYDPKAIDEMKKIYPNIEYSQDLYDAVLDSDCIVSLTEWDSIKNIDFEVLSKLCRNRVIYDTRNLYNRSILDMYGFKCLNMGYVN